MAKKLTVKAQAAAVRALLEEGVSLNDIRNKRVDLSKGVAQVEAEQQRTQPEPSQARGSGTMGPLVRR